MLEVDNGTYECNYYPVSSGQYLVAISWGGHSIPRRSEFISGGGGRRGGLSGIWTECVQIIVD